MAHPQSPLSTTSTLSLVSLKAISNSPYYLVETASTEFIGLSLCIYIFVNYARTRQLKNYMKTEKPMELQSVTAIK